MSMSKPIPKKEQLEGSLTPKVTTESRYKAPIPLYPEVRAEKNIEPVKLKLKKNPAGPNTAANQYEKFYQPFDGDTVEEYCEFRVLLEHYIANAGVTSEAEKITSVEMLLTGGALVNWENCKQTLITEQGGTTLQIGADTCESLLSRFAASYCTSHAKQDQWMFMQKRLKLPNGIRVRAFYNRMRTMNRYIKYLPGDGEDFGAMALRHMLTWAMPEFMRVSMLQNAYRYDDPALKMEDYVEHLENLRLVTSVYKQHEEKRKAKKKHNSAKYKKPEGGYRKTVTCDYCGKKGHSVEKCYKKQKDERRKTEENNLTLAHEATKKKKPATGDGDEGSDAEDFALCGAYLQDMDLEGYDQVSPMDWNTVHEEPIEKLQMLTNDAMCFATTTTDVGMTIQVKLVDNETDNPNSETITALIDTGCSRTIVKKSALDRVGIKAKRSPNKTNWSTNAGKFSTDDDVTIEFALMDFTPSKTIEWQAALDETKQQSTYGMIIGRDLQEALGIDIRWSTRTMQWDEIIVPMKTFVCGKKNTEHDRLMQGTGLFAQTEILDAQYKRADIDKTVESQTHLSKTEKFYLKLLLMEFEELFDGTLGEWKTAPVDLQLKPNAEPFQLQPFAIPQIHMETLRKEINRLCQINVLRRVPMAEYASPSFIIPKKNGTVRVVSDFRMLNSILKNFVHPIPRIQDLLNNLGGFTYATSLDLNMGYYTIRLTPNASKLCTIIFPFGTYEYLRLPMGVKTSPSIFQSKIAELMMGLDFVSAYLDDVLMITKNDFQDHLKCLRKVLERIRSANLRINVEKSFFATQQLEYLGFLVTRQGIRPIASKVEAIQRLQRPKTLKQLRSFLGMVNYYRDMWKRRSHILAPLTDSLKVPKGSRTLRWGPKQDKAFEDIKQIITSETMLKFPDFSKPFDIHTDASDTQLGAVLSQNGHPVAFYSRKLNSAQQNYTVGEREMLSVVETLKEYRTILLGREITVFTDHKNLTLAKTVSQSQRVRRWHCVIDEFAPVFKYIQGTKNLVADALSRLDADFTIHVEEINYIDYFNSEADDEEIIFPLSTQLIAEHQEKDASINKLRSHPEMVTRTVHGTSVLLLKDKIFIPKALRKNVLKWYHEMLRHPGIDRTERTIRQHLVWPGLHDDVVRHVSSCIQCQKCKKTRRKYGHLPPKTFQSNPWDYVCVDQIGPYTVHNKDGKDVTLNAMTMCDPATGWFEVGEVPDKTSETAAKIFDNIWLCRYPRPKYVIYDNGNEFTGQGFQELLRSYKIRPNPTTVKNPQANLIERVHQTLGNMLRTYELENYDFDRDDPWTDILASCAWAIRSTVHTVLDATPAQLVFGRDMIFDLAFTRDWEKSIQKRQAAIMHNNAKENKKRVPHTYSVGDKVLLERGNLQRKLAPLRDGPYKIIKVYPNGTLQIQKGIVRQRVSIRRCTPYSNTASYN